MAGSYWIETLGCPKNQVDSDKLVGTLVADGLVAAEAPESADVVVVNTCAFVEEARQESIDVIATSMLVRPRLAAERMRRLMVGVPKASGRAIKGRWIVGDRSSPRAAR